MSEWVTVGEPGPETVTWPSNTSYTVFGYRTGGTVSGGTVWSTPGGGCTLVYPPAREGPDPDGVPARA